MFCSIGSAIKPVGMANHYYLSIEMFQTFSNESIVVSFQRVDPELVFTKQERIGKGSFGEVYKVCMVEKIIALFCY